MKLENLNKCPFCGHKPLQYMNPKQPEFFRITCITCGLHTTETHLLMAQKLWQTNNFTLDSKQDAALYFIRLSLRRDTALRVKDKT